MMYDTRKPRLLHPPRTGATSLVMDWRLAKTDEYRGHEVPEQESPYTFMYGFARSPWTRATSLWWLFNKKSEVPFKDWILDGGLQGEFDGGNAYYRKYARNICRPCHTWLRHAHWVGRFEHRAADLKELSEILGRPIPDGHHNMGAGRFGSLKLEELSQVVKTIEEHFAEDFEHYGYDRGR